MSDQEKSTMQNEWVAVVFMSAGATLMRREEAIAEKFSATGDTMSLAMHPDASGEIVSGGEEYTYDVFS